MGPLAMIYLAAAVSDFYIPPDTQPQHKIQSADGPLHLTLQQVPKMIGHIRNDWCPQAFVVSFKVCNDTHGIMWAVIS